MKEAVTEPDPGSNPTDDNELAVLQDHEDDPVREELTSLISELSHDAQIDLVTLMWLGRDGQDIQRVRASAAQQVSQAPGKGEA